MWHLQGVFSSAQIIIEKVTDKMKLGKLRDQDEITPQMVKYMGEVYKK